MAYTPSLHAQGRKVICYISAGSWESWRPDAGQFPSYLLGKPLSGWACGLGPAESEAAGPGLEAQHLSRIGGLSAATVECREDEINFFACKG
ncbi:MAG: endo alpha-1,4 polygalactosaminidase [Acidobacteriota bacterium]